jgi:hypothetical protein
MNEKNLFSKKIIQNITSYNLPFVVDENKIIGIIKNFLNREKIENVIFEFYLPNKFSNLKPGDVLEISNLSGDKNFDKQKNKFIIQELIFFQDFIKIRAHKYFPEIYNLNSFSILFKDFEGKLNTNFLSQIKKNSKTFLTLTQIPILNKENYSMCGFVGFFFAPLEKNLNWKGTSLFRKYPSSSETFIDQTQKTNIFGKIIDMKKKSLEKISPLLIDYDSEIFISLSFPDSQKIEGASDEEFFSFKNLAKIGDEMICFKEAEYIQNGIYKIKILLRGLFGTESFIESNKINQNFFLIEQNILSEKLENQMIGSISNYKAVTFGETIVNSFESEIFLKNLYSLQHPVCNLEIKKNNSKKFLFSFQKRLRIHGSQFVLNIDENFESSQSVIFEKFNIPGVIQEVQIKNSHGFLIRIFDDNKKEKLISENVISDLFFEFNPENENKKIYIEIASLNSIYLNYYYVSFFADLENCEILGIEFHAS